ncbi:MAG TPA: cytochrome c [Kofleriaceae bacterium]|nr:cytochrome c [Kofleriaceae bacterium]
MDFPVFHLDWLNNRGLIAIIAILHVVINHAMAVGGIPLIAYLERRGVRATDGTQAQQWDRLAFRMLAIFFFVTTTVGALTGVGIWLSAGLVNPYAIGSLIRVFFWAWFTEWIVFVTEVVLILAYYLSWKKWVGTKKVSHVKLGFGLALASWLTMAIIVAILSFMMDPGSWGTDRTLLSGFLNPLYLPQLAFRTPVAMVMAGAFGLVVTAFVTPRRSEIQAAALRAIGGWMLAWMPLCLVGGYWYATRVPVAMKAQLPVALLTQQLAQWSHGAITVLVGAVVAIGLIALWARLAPRTLPRVVLLVPALLAILLLGTFERVREFTRKPYAIPGYLYSNGFRKADYPILQRDGVLAHATYTRVRQITSDNEVEAGREVFNLTCTRCHTVDGINGIRAVVANMYGNQPWSVSALDAYIGMMHNARPYMPPFPGNGPERKALATYLVYLQNHADTINGAQRDGVMVLPRPRRLADGTLIIAQ